jgi:energy-coupling factor transporter ATP-binding protein EcfA2
MPAARGATGLQIESSPSIAAAPWAILALKVEGATMVHAEQNLHFAACVADRAVVIEQGRAAWSGRWPRWKPVRQCKHGFWRSDPDRQLLRSPRRNRFV